MNWLQRLCQSKPMALPVEFTQEHAKDTPGGFKPPGITNIDRLMTPQTSQRELKRDPDIQYFGAGVHGVATQSKGLVRKFVHTSQEAINAYDVMKNPRPFLIVVKNVEKIQEQPPLWAIDSEKVEPLPRDEAEIATEIVEELQDNDRIIDPDELIEQGFDPQTVDRVFHDYMRFLEGLSEDPNFDWGDAWGDNLGRTPDRRLVLLDLGGANTEEMSRELPPELQLVQLMS